MAEIPLTRASLLVRLRDPRDGAAWGEFVDLYAPLVYGYLRKQGLQDADAADLSQEVLGAVAGAVGRLEYDPRRGAFRNWLFTVVRRKLSNWRAGQGSRARGSGDTATYRLLEQCPVAESVEAEWEAEWERRLFAWACEQVRRSVTDVTWQAFWRTAVERISPQDVAGRLGMSVGAVYAAKSRVLARLRRQIEQARCDTTNPE
jgi:RNA polymerase sigma factor (sigma-70 family)